MTLRQYILVMLLSTALCFAAWGYVLFNVDPYHAHWTGFLFFYLSLGLSLFGMLTLIISPARYLITRKYETLYHTVQKSFRSAALISVIGVFLIFLYSVHLLNTWTLGIFSTLITLLFFLLFSLKHRT